MTRGVAFLSSPVGLVTWNPSDKDATISLSSGNLLATKITSTGLRSVRATKGLAHTSKAYFEIYVETGAVINFMLVGLSTTALSTSNFVGFNATSWGYYQNTGQKYTNNVASAYGATWRTGDTIGIALDNGKIWFAKNGVWQASGNPAAGTGEAFSGLTGTLYPTGSLESLDAGGDKLRARFTLASFAYSPPSGFTAWEDA